jgi:ABC-type multidrug transport system ATPase subunit
LCQTSLLNILAGRVCSRGDKLVIESDIRINNCSINPAKISVRRKIAFVAQDDSLQITATPREAIRFSAKLRLPRTITDEAIDELTEDMLEELGLLGCANVLVGKLYIRLF